MKIAVTAASGRLGRATLTKLCEMERAADVVGVARNPDRIEVPGVGKRAGDYDSVEQMTAALDGIDTVVMISAPAVMDTDRVTMHRNVIEAAKRAGVRKVIYTSVIGGSGADDTMFSASQQLNRQAEVDLAESGLEWIIARNGLYVELDLGHIIRANESGVYRNNGGEGRCGYISIDELAYATAALATNDICNGRIVNLTSENKTQAELVELANDVFGLDVRYEPITVEQNMDRFMADEKIAARGEEVAQMLTGCFQCIEKGAFDVSSHYQDAAGRAPKMIREQFEEIRERG